MNKEPNCKLNGHGFNSDGICIYCHQDDGSQTKATNEGSSTDDRANTESQRELAKRSKYER